MKFGSVTITIKRERPKTDLMLLHELSPAAKLDAVKAMGFVAMWDDHQPDCAALWASGTRCICVPPGTSWHAPKDVKEFMGETWEGLSKIAQARGD